MTLTVRSKLFLNALFAVAATCAVSLAGYVGIGRIDESVGVIVD